MPQGWHIQGCAVTMRALNATGRLVFTLKSPANNTHSTIAMRIAHAGCLAFALMLSTAANAADVSAERRSEIQKLLTLTQPQQLDRQMAASMADLVRDQLRSQPQVDDATLAEVQKELDTLLKQSLDSGALQTDLIAVYAKHFTHDEVKALVRFYESPVGRRMIAKQPDLLTDSMAAGRKWFDGLQPEIERRVRAVLERHGVATKPAAASDKPIAAPAKPATAKPK